MLYLWDLDKGGYGKGIRFETQQDAMDAGMLLVKARYPEAGEKT
jgi:hypothetical protein